MKKNHAFILLPACLLFGMVLCPPLKGQEIKKTGTSAAAFLRIPAGAKAIAMGSAFTAIADDGSAMVWNPGATARLKAPVLFVHHSPWLPGLDHGYFGFLAPISGLGVVGINVVSLRSEEMDITTPEAPMGTGETFDAASTAIGLVFSRSLTDRFSIGVNMKFIQERIFHSDATGFAFDVGTLFVTPFKDIRFGVSISNIGTRMQMDGEDLNSYVDTAPNQEGNNDELVARIRTDRFDMPMILRLGISGDIRFTRNTRLTLAVEGVNPNDNAQSLNAGCELAVWEVFFMRGGFNEIFLDNREKGMTLGAGFRLPAVNRVRLGLAYAWQDFHYLNAVNHFSLEIQF